MLQVNEIVALVIAVICAVYLISSRSKAQRNGLFDPALYAFTFVFISLAAVNLQPFLWKGFFILVEHWALALAGLALAWQAYSLLAHGEEKR